MICKFFAAVLAFFISLTAFAYDFTAADELFARRDESPQVLAEARSAYKFIVPQVVGAEKIYAVEQLARLSYFEGVTSKNPEHIKKVAMEAYDMLEIIRVVDGVTPAHYYYWKAACLAAWIKETGVLSALSRTKEIVDLVEKGIATDPTYEGGGFHRIGSAVYARLPVINPLGPKQDLVRAEQYLNKALNAPAYAGAEYPATSTGDYYFEVFEAQADILVKRNKRADAIAVLKAAIQRIDDGDFSPEREPEARGQRANLQRALIDIQ